MVVISTVTDSGLIPAIALSRMSGAAGSARRRNARWVSSWPTPRRGGLNGVLNHEEGAVQEETPATPGRAGAALSGNAGVLAYCRLIQKMRASEANGLAARELMPHNISKTVVHAARARFDRRRFLGRFDSKATIARIVRQRPRTPADHHRRSLA